MAGRDPVEVVRAFGLQIQVYVGQFFSRLYAPAARPVLADLMILTEGAGKVAVGEEDGSGAILAAYARLLAPVNAPRGDFSQAPRFADAEAVDDALGAAVSRTDPALHEQLEQGFHPSVELAAFQKIQVGRVHVYSRCLRAVILRRENRRQES